MTINDAEVFNTICKYYINHDGLMPTQTNVKNRLNLSKQKFNLYIENLIKNNLIVISNNKIKFTSEGIRLKNKTEKQINERRIK